MTGFFFRASGVEKPSLCQILKGVSLMKRHLPFAAALLLFILSVPSIPQTCGVRCGKERWKVKTLTDTTVVNVDLDPVEKSINWLRTRTRPSSLPNTKRLIGTETMVFKVKGVVLSFKKEDDKDFHVIIAQSNNHGRTLIAIIAQSV